MSANHKEMSLRQLAAEIKKDWKNVHYTAKPYLDAMLQLENVNQNYGLDSGKSMVIYFLSNATSWRGEVARQIKAELKERIK